MVLSYGSMHSEVEHKATESMGDTRKCNLELGKRQCCGCGTGLFSDMWQV